MSSDPSLRRGPSAGESHVNIHGESFTDADLRNAGQDWGDSDPCLEQFLSTTGRRGVCRRERGHGGDHIDGDLAWTLAASPPVGDSRLTEEKDSLSPGNTGQEEPQAVRLQPPPDNATVAKDLSDWLRESVRSGYLFGCYDEPLDDAGKRIVRAIVARLEAV